MADFDLTQTDAQVQSILNDGQNMQGAGAQTTLTTESVLLKDVNGNYHKILKSSFTEAIRDTLAGLLVNNDKGTTINQIAAIASGDFGSITPGNLASVLGDQVMRFKNVNADINEIYGNGLRLYQYTTLQPINHPSGASQYGVLLSIGSSISPFGTIQIWCDVITAKYKFYARVYFETGWRSWKQISNE